MAGDAFEVPFGPPFMGMNTYLDPKSLPANMLQSSAWADIAKGVVTGYWGAGTTFATATASLRFLYYQASAFLNDTTLLADGTTNWACRDAPDSNNAQVAYVTKTAPNGTLGTPQAYYGGSQINLGIIAPAYVPSLTNGSSAGAATYAYTLYDSVHKIESNPTVIGTVTACGGAIITALPSLGSTMLTGNNADTLRFYRTNSGTQSTSVKYYLGSTAITASTPNYTDPTGAGDLSGNGALNWGPTGSAINLSTSLSFDHSPAPQLTCISDALHGSALGTNGLGFVFGAVGATVYWSQEGSAHYWPTVNFAKLPFTVLALVTRGGYTYAFTEGGIWSFSGLTDGSIQIHRAANALGVLRLAGKSVVQSPQGILYLSREGPTLFDGYNSRPMLQSVIDQGAWLSSSFTYYCGVYFDGWYYLQVGGGNTWGIDMRRFPNVSATTVNVTAGAFAVVPYGATGPTPGLYYVNNTSGVIAPWRPMEGGNVSGAAQGVWSATGPRTDLGMPSKLKRITQIRADVAGTITLSLSAYKGTLSANTVTITLVGNNRTYRVSPALEGTHFDAAWAASTGADQLVAMNLIGEVFNAS